MKCEAKTSKKAWSNPLAPHARCTKDATVEAKVDGNLRKLCTVHARQLDGGRSLNMVKACCGTLFYACGCKTGHG